MPPRDEFHTSKTEFIVIKPYISLLVELHVPRCTIITLNDLTNKFYDSSMSSV